MAFSKTQGVKHKRRAAECKKWQQVDTEVKLQVMKLTYHGSRLMIDTERGSRYRFCQRILKDLFGVPLQSMSGKLWPSDVDLKHLVICISQFSWVASYRVEARVHQNKLNLFIPNYYF
ncbi:hypothetical protein SLA2020_481120 [Shorea laevis]